MMKERKFNVSFINPNDERTTELYINKFIVECGVAKLMQAVREQAQVSDKEERMGQ